MRTSATYILASHEVNALRRKTKRSHGFTIAIDTAGYLVGGVHSLAKQYYILVLMGKKIYFIYHLSDSHDTTNTYASKNAHTKYIISSVHILLRYREEKIANFERQQQQPACW